MSIVYDPKKLLRKIAPEAKVERLVTDRLTLKKAALSFVDSIDFIDKKKVSEVALKTIRGYKLRAARATAEAALSNVRGERTRIGGPSAQVGREVAEELAEDPRQLIQRVQNEVVLQVAAGIRETYAGETYTWLPSDADEPDPEHQSNYGKTFTIGVGEMPGERIGCRCGMEIHVKQTQLKLD